MIKCANPVEKLLTRFSYEFLQTAFHLLETYWCWQVRRCGARPQFGLMLNCTSHSNLNTSPYTGLPFYVGFGPAFLLEQASVSEILFLLYSGDMAAPGPYCNQFLLNMLYAQATPIAYPSGIPLTVTDMSGAPLKTTTADQFTDRAKLLLMAEMDKPTSIPTIQGLFILAGSECSRGNSSAGWLYAGMVRLSPGRAVLPYGLIALSAGLPNDARFGHTPG